MRAQHMHFNSTQSQSHSNVNFSNSVENNNTKNKMKESKHQTWIHETRRRNLNPTQADPKCIPKICKRIRNAYSKSAHGFKMRRHNQRVHQNPATTNHQTTKHTAALHRTLPHAIAQRHTPPRAVAHFRVRLRLGFKRLSSMV